MAIEEFGSVLSNSTTELILESLVNATIGDSYRVGGVDSDNLYPSYSNPSIMRAFVSGWTGRRVGDKNMTVAGEAYAQEIIDLFNLHNTLSEFNSGTYTGVSLFGLTLWAKYLPKCSVMTQNGPKMLQATWDAVAQLWHRESTVLFSSGILLTLLIAGMKNMAGPWDRAYGYDMNKYVSLMALWFWTILGKEHSSLISKVHCPSAPRHQPVINPPPASSHVPHGRLRLGPPLRRPGGLSAIPHLQRHNRQALQVRRRAHLQRAGLLPSL